MIRSWTSLRRTKALTLVELIIVIAILAALASMVIPKVDFARRQADMAASANVSGEVANNIQMYLSTTGSLPNGLDTLLADNGGTLDVYDKVFDSPPSIVSQSTVTTITNSATDGRVKSLSRIGVKLVYDHDTTADYASNSGSIARTLDRSDGATNTLLVIDPGTDIWNSVYPPDLGVPTDVSLVVLGIGPGNSMNGITMTSPPLYSAPVSDERYYRYVGVFAVYFDGSRAQFKCCVDSFGRTINQALEQYIEAKPK